MMKKVLLFSLTLSLCLMARGQGLRSGESIGTPSGKAPCDSISPATNSQVLAVINSLKCNNCNINEFYTLNKDVASSYRAVPVKPGGREQDPGPAAAGDSLSSYNGMPFTKRVAVSFRTNLLVPLLNVGLEVPIGKHFSIAGDIYYPWLGYDKKNANCLQAALADVQLRWWLCPRAIDGLRGNTLTGSFISLGCYAGLYDFERNNKGLQGEIYGAYIDYGYTFYLARHFRLTLNVGAGAARIPYRTYTVYSEGGHLIKDRLSDNIKIWYGPVHAGVVLLIPIMEGKRYEKE